MRTTHLSKLTWHERFSYQKNIVFNEGALQQTGAKFQVIRFAPHASVGPHVHVHVCETFLVWSGQGTFTFNGVPQRGNKGSIFLCEPRDVHAIANDGNEELVLFIFKTHENPHDIAWIEPEDQRRHGIPLP